MDCKNISTDISCRELFTGTAGALARNVAPEVCVRKTVRALEAGAGEGARGPNEVLDCFGPDPLDVYAA
jgi:hypothetical protein